MPIDAAARATLLRKAGIAVLTIPIIAVVFTGLLTAVMALPNDTIKANVLDRPEVLLDRRADNGRVIDADTECIGLSVGLYDELDAELRTAPGREQSPATPFRRAIEAKSLYGCTPFLLWLEEGAEPPLVRPYFRYWHGHGVLSRPLLSVLPYNEMRGVLFTISVLLLGWLAWRIGHDHDALTALAFVAPFLVLNAHGYWVVATKATTWVLLMGAALLATRLGRRETPVLLFFGIGALTAFGDFLTAPSLVFAFPALIWFFYAAKRRGLEKPVVSFVALGGFWFIGYAGLWLAKIAIAALALGDMVWADVFGAITMRLRGGDAQIDTFLPGAAILANLSALKSVWLAIALVLYGVGPAARAPTRAAIVGLVRRAPVFLLVVVAPLLWMETLSNHSQIHAAFTHLNFAPLFALLGLALLRKIDDISLQADPNDC